MAPAALPHLSDDILAYMAAEFWAKSPVYDVIRGGCWGRRGRGVGTSGVCKRGAAASGATSSAAARAGSRRRDTSRCSPQDALHARAPGVWLLRHTTSALATSALRTPTCAPSPSVNSTLSNPTIATPRYPTPGRRSRTSAKTPLP